MKIPGKITNVDIFTKYRTTYKFNKVVYKGCYEYIHFWQNAYGKWKCFKCYLEKGNIIYKAWINRNMPNYKNHFNFEFEGEIETENLN